MCDLLSFGLQQAVVNNSRRPPLLPNPPRGAVPRTRVNAQAWRVSDQTPSTACTSPPRRAIVRGVASTSAAAPPSRHDGFQSNVVTRFLDERVFSPLQVSRLPVGTPLAALQWDDRLLWTERMGGGRNCPVPVRQELPSKKVSQVSLSRRT